MRACVCLHQLHYEQQIAELEQKLVQRQNPEGATPPPCPSTEGSEQQRVKEAQLSVELALQEQIQSLQQQLSRKVPHTQSTNPSLDLKLHSSGRYAQQ